jgi:hypothetical protein
MISIAKKSILILLLIFTLNACKDKESTSPDSKDFVHEGSCIFWTQNSYYCPIDVYIDNVFAGTITTSDWNVPDCNTSGFVTVKKEIGTHNFHCVNSQYYWDDTITINQVCCSMRLN